jgi:hypothetical protein
VFSAEELGALYLLADLERAEPLLVADTWDRLGLAVDGAECAPGAPTVRTVEADGLALLGTHGCSGSGTLTVVAGYLQALGPGHETEIVVDGRIVATVERGMPIARVPFARGEDARWPLVVVVVLLVLAGAALSAWNGRGRAAGGGERG